MIEALARADAKAFAGAAPFPHLVFDDFLDPGTAEAVLAEFAAPGGDWKHYYHVNERKHILGQAAQMGPRTQDLIARWVGVVRTFVTPARARRGSPEGSSA